LVSIGISALTTGFTSAMMAFDIDVDMQRRLVQPKFYGYIPDDNSLRGRVFLLMMLSSCVHNLSRSISCALLAASEGGQSLLVYFIGGEMVLYVTGKILRSDFFWWPRVQGFLATPVSLTGRVLVKIIADYTGCLHLRHPFELGGLMFSLNMIWAQVFPFVALHLVDGKMDDSEGIRSDEIFLLLSGNLILWVLLNVIFFCTIDISYLKTFFGTKTGPQYAVELYEETQSDELKFDAIFTNRIQFTKPIHEKAKIWIAEHVNEWRMEEPDWFKIEMIPDEFLPGRVVEEVGGAMRRRRTVTVREIVGLERSIKEKRVVPIGEKRGSIDDNLSLLRSRNRIAWSDLAEEVYLVRSNNYKSNFIFIKQIFSNKEELVRELMEQCPKFMEILSHILEDKFGWRVQKVDWTSEMKDWGLEECRRVGCSLATFIRKRKTGLDAVDAWRLHYAQLDVLFKEIVGFEEFVLVIVNNTLRDSIYGMIYRVSVGALLSMTDAVTDIYVISTYYKSEELVVQANTLLTMLITNLFVQLCSVIAQYKQKGWLVMAREAAITIAFLRPPVDAYRVSTNHEDDQVTFDTLSEMISNKGSELACESIPGCVLQLYVWLLAPEKAGKYSLLSIGISCLTTGFTSAMIAFDMDVHVTKRNSQPKFYGYIPNDNALRGRCFLLMTMMGALHNLSRSLGCALFAASNAESLFLMLVGGEIGLYILFKIVRRDFYWWPVGKGIVFVIGSLVERICVKIIVDFSGCIHLRHPYELGGLVFTLSVIWAQIFPFVALQYFDGDMRDGIIVFLGLSFLLWLVLNIIFFCTIDLSYLNTFFGTKTASQYTCELFMTSKDDFQKFTAIFTNNIRYTKTIHEEVKLWVAAKINQWKIDKPDWFKTEMIPDVFLPKEVFEAEGGAERRRRKSTSMAEMMGLKNNNSRRVHPQVDEEMKVEEL